LIDGRLLKIAVVYRCVNLLVLNCKIIAIKGSCGYKNLLMPHARLCTLGFNAMLMI
jgi:hypothetical protein